MGVEDFVNKLASKSGIEEEKEELLGVENMINVEDLERKVNILEARLNEKDKALNEKDKEIERLKAQLKDNESN